MNKKILKFIKKQIEKNYAWFIAIFSFLGILASSILKFSKYAMGYIQFKYYGLDLGLYKFNDTNFLYDIILALITTVLMFLIMYCMEEFNNKKNRLVNGFLILICNCIVIFCSTTQTERNIIIMFLCLLLLMVTESITSFLFNSKHIDKLIESSKIKPLKEFLAIIIVIFLSIVLNTYLNFRFQKEYRIINDNKVIVYTTSDYYLTLDCTINNKVLTIYKGTQEKINNNNVYSKLIEFEKVEMRK